MKDSGRIPADYDRVDTGDVGFVFATDCAQALLAAGLDRVEGWQRRLRGPAGKSGRGPLARLTLEDGTRVVIKQMRRGGLFAPLWRDRYPGEDRLLDNVRVPVEAMRRGVATARPLALLLRGGPPGFNRGWLATQEIAGTEDLRSLIGSEHPPTEDEIDRVVSEIRRMHDVGVEHPDLNLGNLLLRRRAVDGPHAFIVDLDRARLEPGPLAWRKRIHALRRLERSSVKQFGERPLAVFDLRRRWYTAYAEGDARAVERLEKGRRSNRLWLALHRAGWRQGDSVGS